MLFLVKPKELDPLDQSSTLNVDASARRWWWGRFTLDGEVKPIDISDLLWCVAKIKIGFVAHLSPHLSLRPTVLLLPIGSDRDATNARDTLHPRIVFSADAHTDHLIDQRLSTSNCLQRLLQKQPCLKVAGGSLDERGWLHLQVCHWQLRPKVINHHCVKRCKLNLATVELWLPSLGIRGGGERRNADVVVVEGIEGRQCLTLHPWYRIP